MKQNVSELEAFGSLVGGLTLFGIGIINKKRPAIFLGSVRIATGLTKWCPVRAFMGKVTAKNYNNHSEETAEE